jgi:hypothetical protein
MQSSTDSVSALLSHTQDPALQKIGFKILNGERLQETEGVTLFEKGSQIGRAHV